MKLRMESNRWFQRLGTYLRQWLPAAALLIGVAIVITVAIITNRTQLSAADGVIISAVFLILENLFLLLLGRENLDPALDKMDLLGRNLKELDRQHILLRHETIALDDFVLRDEYVRVVNDFSNRVSDLAIGHFVRDIQDINRMSIEIVRSLTNEAFATVIVGKTDQIFQFPSTDEFLEACYAAAKQINHFTRLFVIDDFVDITPDLYNLMETHARERIRVLVITRKDIKEKDLGRIEDFGLWDQRYLITLESDPAISPSRLRMTVQGGDLKTPAIAAAQKRTEQLSEAASTWEEFKEDLSTPINYDSWLSLLPEREFLEPPAGPSAKDATVMRELAAAGNRCPKRALVLGYTREIVRCLSEEISEVDVLDVGVFRPQDPNVTTFFGENWLTWELPNGKEGYDVIAGDDVMNNLGIWQFHTFFKRMRALLKPSGIFVMRASGCYSQTPQAFPDFETVLGELKDHGPSAKLENFVIANCWPLFHGPEFYDDRSRSFDLRDWNQRLRQAEQTPGEFAKFRIEQPLTQTSIPFEEILDYARPWFNLSEQRHVDDDYTNQVVGLDNYYRILSFTPRPEPLE